MDRSKAGSGRNESAEAREGCKVQPSADIRPQVRKLVSAHRALRREGARLLPERGGRARILHYFRDHVGQVLDGEEIMVIGGISEYARRIRELRVEDGWPILSGKSVREMAADAGDQLDLFGSFARMKPSQYLLREDVRDADAASRWRIANSIRRSKDGVQVKLLRFFQANVGRQVTSEELRYVAGNRSEWARRTRELRTEEGWPVMTRFTGDPDLPMGAYVLARNEQAPVHDRHIPELVRREVMERDSWSCRWLGCGWSPSGDRRDLRFLEVHHLVQHVDGGTNEAHNLLTLCNLHHDEVHLTGRLETAPIRQLPG